MAVRLARYPKGINVVPTSNIPSLSESHEDQNQILHMTALELAFGLVLMIVVRIFG